MKRWLARLDPAVMAFLCGLVLLSAGAALVYPPAGLVVLGGLLVLDCYLPDRHRRGR